MKNNRPHPNVMRFNTEENTPANDNQEKAVPDDVIAHLTHQFADKYEQALHELAYQSPHRGSQQLQQ